MADKNPTKSLAILAVVAATLVACWFLFFARHGEPGGAAGPADELARRESNEARDARPGRGEETGQPGPERGPSVPTPDRERATVSTLVSGVVERAGRTELSGAQVHLVPAPATEEAFSFLSFTNPDQLKRLERIFKPQDPVQTKTLDAAGRFAFENPPAGRYELGFEHDLLRLAQRTIVEVEKGERKDLGLVHTELAGSLVVVVTDSEGAPVAGASLKLKTRFDPMSFADPEKLTDLLGLMRQFIPAVGKTDERGVYRFGGLQRSGPFLLAVAARGHAPRSKPVQVADGMQAIARVRLSAAAKARIVVKDRDGEPVAGARIKVTPHAPESDDSAMFVAGDDYGVVKFRTDENGIGEADSMVPARASIVVRALNLRPFVAEVVLEAGRTLERTVVLERGLSISGTVVDVKERPIEGAAVGNVPEIGQSFMGFELPTELLAMRPRGRGVRTDADGKFTLAGLDEEQEAHLLVVADGFAPAKLGPVKAGSKDHVVKMSRLGRILGRVVTEEDDAPLPRFEVYCAKAQYMVFEGRLGKPKLEGDGRFVLSDVPQGRQTLVIEADGRTPLRLAVEVAAGDRDVGTLELIPAAAIEGIVVDTAQSPVEGAKVRLSRGGFADFEILAKMRGQEIATTDEQGRFRLDEVPAKRVKLIAERKGYALKKSKVVRVERGKVAKDVRIVLDAGGSILGRIVDEDGGPLPGWAAQVTGTRTATIRMAKSDAQGEVRISGLAPGEYQVQAFPSDWGSQITKMMRTARKPGKEEGMPDIGGFMSTVMRKILQTKVTVRAGKQAEFKLVSENESRRSGLTHVDGFVAIAGKPVAHGFVELMELGGAPRMQFASVRDGVFEFRGLQPGSYRVRVRSGFLNGASFQDEIVHVPERERFRMELALPGGRIAGRVVYASDAEPAAHVVIKLTNSREAKHFNPTVVEDVGQGMWLTDAKGRFSFDGLPAGTYRITARELTFVAGRSGGGVLPGIVLADGEVREGLELRLGGGGDLHVRVVDSSGPRAQAVVRLLDAAGLPAGILQVQLTDADGKATFSGLPAGTYRALVDADDAAPTTSREVRIAESGEDSVEVLLTGGVAVRVVLEGEPPATRSGEMLVFSVWDAAGRLVRAGPASLSTVLGKAQRKDGLRVGSLRPGTYRVRVESSSLGVLEAEREVPDEKETVWKVDLEKRTWREK